MITHGHVLVNGKKIDSPSYLITESEIKSITFNEKSPFISEEHPERKKPEEENEKNAGN